LSALAVDETPGWTKYASGSVTKFAMTSAIRKRSQYR
jgi:hypothetical protein